MFGLHLTLYHHIVYVDLNVLALLWFEHPCHHSLISGPRIFQLEGHHFVMIIPCECNEGSLLLITSSQGYLVVSLKSIQEAHLRMARGCIYQLIYPRQGERILWANLIYVHEVYTHLPFPTFLLHHHRVGQPLGVKHFLYGSSLLKFELRLRRISPYCCQ